MVYTTGPCCLGPVEETHPHRWLHTSGLDILCHSARLELALLEHKNQQSVIYWNWQTNCYKHSREVQIPITILTALFFDIIVGFGFNLL
jgi:hypothetical protein